MPWMYVVFTGNRKILPFIFQEAGLTGFIINDSMLPALLFISLLLACAGMGFPDHEATAPRRFLGFFYSKTVQIVPAALTLLLPSWLGLTVVNLRIMDFGNSIDLAGLVLSVLFGLMFLLTFCWKVEPFLKPE